MSMFLLATLTHDQLAGYPGWNLGRLIVPKNLAAIELTADSGRRWAADNGGYHGVDLPLWRRMLDRIETLPGCLFVTIPDVVGDHAATLRLWQRHARVVTIHPRAFVLQDGCRRIPVNADAVFIGGTTEFKMSSQARKLVEQAQRAGLWVHMGRVNSERRIRYAASIGCNSVDGTNWALFRDSRGGELRRGVALCAAPRQLAFHTMAGDWV